jgi:hypothetical protein
MTRKLILIFAAALSGAAWAGENPMPPAVSAAEDAIRWTEFRGTVTKVDLSQDLLLLQDPTTRKSIGIPVTGDVRIYDGRNRPRFLGDLRRGQRVVVRNDAAKISSTSNP